MTSAQSPDSEKRVERTGARRGEAREEQHAHLVLLHVQRAQLDAAAHEARDPACGARVEPGALERHEQVAVPACAILHECTATQACASEWVAFDEVRGTARLRLSEH